MLKQGGPLIESISLLLTMEFVPPDPWESALLKFIDVFEKGLTAW